MQTMLEQRHSMRICSSMRNRLETFLAVSYLARSRLLDKFWCLSVDRSRAGHSHEWSELRNVRMPLLHLDCDNGWKRVLLASAGTQLGIDAVPDIHMQGRRQDPRCFREDRTR